MTLYNFLRPAASAAPQPAFGQPRSFASPADAAAATGPDPQVGWAPAAVLPALGGVGLGHGPVLAGVAPSWSPRRVVQPSPLGGLQPAWQQQLAHGQQMAARAERLSRRQVGLTEERGRAEAWRESLAQPSAGTQAPFVPGLQEGGASRSPITSAAGIDTYLKELTGRQTSLSRHLNWAQEAAKQAQDQLNALISMWSNLLKSMHQTIMGIIGNLR